MKSDCDEFERQKKQQSLFLLPRAMRISEQCYERCMKMIQNESHRIEIKHILRKKCYFFTFFTNLYELREIVSNYLPSCVEGLIF